MYRSSALRIAGAVLVSLLAAAPQVAAQAAPQVQTPQAAGPLSGTPADTVQAHLRVARSDLRNLVVAQEAYFSDHGRYAAKLADLPYQPSRGSNITLAHAEANGWGVSLTRSRLRGSCVIYVNLAAEKRPKTAAGSITPDEGEPRCDDQPELAAAAPTARP